MRFHAGTSSISAMIAADSGVGWRPGWLARTAIAFVFGSISVVVPAVAQALGPAPLAAPRLVTPPPGFTDSCKRYKWFCQSQTADAKPSGEGTLVVADRINRKVNATLTELSDPVNYGVAEYWTLPANGNGDCEDFVLQKYRLLMDAGIASRNLSIAVVLDDAGDNHVVLVLRHRSGDLVLDSLTSRIRPWNQTGYTFIAMQSGANKAEWEMVMNPPRDSNVLARR